MNETSHDWHSGETVEESQLEFLAPMTAEQRIRMEALFLARSTFGNTVSDFTRIVTRAKFFENYVLTGEDKKPNG